MTGRKKRRPLLRRQLHACFLILILVRPGSAVMVEEGEDRTVMNNEMERSAPVDMNNLKITVIFDNNPFRPGLTTGWGFACLIRGTEKTILFDTGADGAVLLANMQKLGVDLAAIDIVVLSHAHRDHVGGLEDLLAVNPAVTVFLPRSFPAQFKNRLQQAGVQTTEVRGFTPICDNVYSTGELGVDPIEQSLLVHGGTGIIVITGCAHPGIVKILATAKKLLQADEILLAMGGFHLPKKNPEELREMATAFRRLGVRRVGPCHCSGDAARQIFAEEYGEQYIEVGVGREISGNELE
jgi:7,8-dihydropterin-6-yl-methyl-4-(beta-D-ribofuranosyl)aminobenzene 5'-phosphate synthase